MLSQTVEGRVEIAFGKLRIKLLVPYCAITQPPAGCIKCRSRFKFKFYYKPSPDPLGFHHSCEGLALLPSTRPLSLVRNRDQEYIWKRVVDPRNKYKGALEVQPRIGTCPLCVFGFRVSCPVRGYSGELTLISYIVQVWNFRRGFPS